MPGPPDLRGKGAIVTGGGSGICLAFTKELYQRGCNVLICDLGLHREAQTWLETLTTNSDNNDKNNGDEPPPPPPPPRVVFNKTDVSDWKQLEAAFDVYEKEFGGVPYVLCPGAGVYEPSAPNFWNDKDDDGYKLLKINLEHPIKMSRIAIRKWVQQQGQTGPPTPRGHGHGHGHEQGKRKRPPIVGNIVLVSSTGAQKSSILTPLYGAAKQGISNFARAMAGLREMEGIRVTAVAPGPTMSPLMYDHPEAIRFVDPEKDKLCSTDEIARGMMAVCFEEGDADEDVDADQGGDAGGGGGGGAGAGEQAKGGGEERKKFFPPGTVLEVTHPNRWREVKLLDDPGPGPHAWTSRKEEAIVDVVKALEEDRKGGK
ncbi:hypothetical protein LTR99_005871 [Exophiala xenobiotica]|uniref:Uncharacterized protein n=1 Tax=Vermiconidia calcicola TaxID=1690605 RepID=A0AAV9QD34_9PEZI|nr:hypothetical protein H2202_000255 [Exophiala xenobiotica]KAK5541055.1 hypothetical protein LTR25_002832 [Vermiconidia calcicola]KAK5549452.1 hypothetical protein LTR23_000560 [Chaetothyriales sp. CCFEE 6169]KAK5193898.1 hypothetical protein LTR92_006238 [Exophiala xenobiotica]KAK5208074.1 hypothetical protein LTR41_006010 [Exophiala xenobiotica]